MDQKMKEQIKLGVLETLANVRAELDELQGSENPVLIKGRMPHAAVRGNGHLMDRPVISSVNRIRFRLTRLEQTLQRIEDPDFGNCVQCGREMNVKQLQVEPESDVCQDCFESKSLLTPNYLFQRI